MIDKFYYKESDEINIKFSSSKIGLKVLISITGGLEIRQLLAIYKNNGSNLSLNQLINIFNHRYFTNRKKPTKEEYNKILEDIENARFSEDILLVKKAQTYIMYNLCQKISILEKYMDNKLFKVKIEKDLLIRFSNNNNSNTLLSDKIGELYEKCALIDDNSVMSNAFLRDLFYKSKKVYIDNIPYFTNSFNIYKNLIDNYLYYNIGTTKQPNLIRCKIVKRETPHGKIITYAQLHKNFRLETKDIRIDKENRIFLYYKKPSLDLKNMNVYCFSKNAKVSQYMFVNADVDLDKYIKM